MIILHHKYGQMANRIILISHFAVTSIETDVKLKILNFDDYMDHFDFSHLKDQKLIKFEKHSFFLRLLTSIVYRVFKKSKNVAFINLQSEFNDQKKEFDLKNFVLKNRTKLIIPEGWGFRNHEDLKKHTQMIRGIFLPNSKTIEKLKEFEKKEDEVLIGFHIRKGDYKEYLNGIYYYTDEEYYDLISHIQQLFKTFNHRIILFSNEAICADLFTSENIVVGPGAFIDDFFMLTKCDYIIGPPSTFSLVASFLGNNKYFHITDSKQRPSLSDFKITDSI
jgi:hypothetical protein